MAAAEALATYPPAGPADPAGPAAAAQHVAWAADGRSVFFSAAGGRVLSASHPAASAPALAADLGLDTLGVTALCGCVAGGAVALLVAASDRSVRLYASGSPAAPQRVFRGHAREVHALAVAPGGLLLASGGADCNVLLWDMRSGALLRRLQHHVAPVLTCSFSPPGRRLLVSGSEDGLVKLWNTQTGALLRTFGGHGDAVTSVLFSSLDSHIVVSASRDGFVRLYHLDTSEVLAVLDGHSGPIHSLAFSPDGWLLYSAGADGTARVWALDGVQQLLVVDAAPAGTSDGIVSIAAHPFELSFATIAADGSVAVWGLHGIQTPGTDRHGRIPQSEERHPLSKMLVSAAAAATPDGGRTPPSTRIRRGDSNRSSVESTTSSRPWYSRQSSAASIGPGATPAPRTPRTPAAAHLSIPETPETPDVVAGSTPQPRQLPGSSSRATPTSRTSVNMSALSLDDPQPTPYSVVKRQASLDDIRRDLEHERGVRQQLQERLAYLRRAWHINHADVAVGDELGHDEWSQLMTGHYFGAQVAVRRTRHALATDASVKIWHDEMELLSQLRHPNVVSFYGAALELHAPMMTVTELCEGTVQELTTTGQPLTCREICAVLRDVTAGLTYLHVRALPHGDVCGRKIMLTRHLQAKIAAWGLTACAAATFPSLVTKVPPTATLTLGDAAAQEAKCAADIYAVGALMVELCAHGAPIPGEKRMQISLVPWEPLQILVHRCMEDEPDDRPSAKFLEQLLVQMTTAGGWHEYHSCGPVRGVRRVNNRLELVQ